MDALETLRQSIPDAARDLKINLQTVLADSTLSDAQRWGVAAAAALAAGHAGLREAVLAATNKTDFELLCLAVSAIHGCEVCIKSHEQAVIEGGLSEDQVHDAVRIAATIKGAAIALGA